MVDVRVELTELLLRGGPVPEGLDHGEAAVGLLDVSVQPAGVGPLGDEHPLRAACDRPGHPQRQRNSHHGDQCQQGGEMLSIIASTASTVSTDVSN